MSKSVVHIDDLKRGKCFRMGRKKEVLQTDGSNSNVAQIITGKDAGMVLYDMDNDVVVYPVKIKVEVTKL